MRIDGHHDRQADIAWLRFEGYDSATVVAEETEFGLRELDPADRRIVGLEYWRTSKNLPDELTRDVAGAAPRRRRLILPASSGPEAESRI